MQKATEKKVGRPKVKTDVLQKGWQDAVIDLYSNGASDVEVRILLADIRTDVNTFSDDLWERLLLEDEEFSRTIKKGKILSQAWWEKAGRENLQNQKFNYTGWYMNMKNRFGWADSQKVQHSGNTVIYLDNAFKGL